MEVKEVNGTFKCNQCEFSTHGSGELTGHQLTHAIEATSKIFEIQVSKLMSDESLMENYGIEPESLKHIFEDHITNTSRKESHVVQVVKITKDFVHISDGGNIITTCVADCDFSEITNNVANNCLIEITDWSVIEIVTNNDKNIGAHKKIEYGIKIKAFKIVENKSSFPVFGDPKIVHVDLVLDEATDLDQIIINLLENLNIKDEELADSQREWCSKMQKILKKIRGNIWTCTVCRVRISDVMDDKVVSHAQAHLRYFPGYKCPPPHGCRSETLVKYKKHLTETGHDLEPPEVVPEVEEDKVEAAEKIDVGEDKQENTDVTNVLDELSSFFTESESPDMATSENLVQESASSNNTSESNSEAESENLHNSSSNIVFQGEESVCIEEGEYEDEENVLEDEQSSVADELVNFFAVDVVDDDPKEQGEGAEEMNVDEVTTDTEMTNVSESHDEEVNTADKNSTDSEMTNVSHGEEAKTADKISTNTEMTNVSESHKGEAKIAAIYNKNPRESDITNSKIKNDKDTSATFPNSNSTKKGSDKEEAEVEESCDTTQSNPSTDVLKKTEDLLENCKESMKDIKELLNEVKSDAPSGVRIEIIPSSSSSVADELASFLSDSKDDPELEIEEEIIMSKTQAGNPKLDVNQHLEVDKSKNETIDKEGYVTEVSLNSKAPPSEQKLQQKSPIPKNQISSEKKSNINIDAGEVAKEFLAFIWERDIAGKVKRSGKYYDCLECGAQMDCGFRTKETHGWGGQKEIFNHFKDSHLKQYNSFKCPICDLELKTFILYLDHLKVKHRQKPSLMKDVIEVQVNTNNNKKRKVIEEIQLDDDDDDDVAETKTAKPPENKKAKLDTGPPIKPFNWHLEMMKRVTIKQKQIWCKLCNYTYSQNQSRALIVHMEAKHFKEFKQLKCNKCETVCDSFTNYNEHMRRKHKEMKFTVNANKKSFFLYIDESSSLDIINESIVHISEKPPNFTWQGEIMRRVQIAENKYRCSDCKFESKPMEQDGGKQILGHIEGVHMNIRGYQCQQCDKIIPNFIEFFKHLNQAHHLTLRLLQNIAL